MQLASSSSDAGGAPAPAAADAFLTSGRPPKSEDPGPVKQALNAAQKRAMAEKREKDKVRDTKLEHAGAVASRELKASQLGVVRHQPSPPLCQ